MTGVFISFSIADQSAASAVERVLRSHGIDVLTGMTVSAGSNLSKAVLEEMQNADAFVFLISKQFVKSQWTQIEVAAAMAQVTSGSEKRLVPVLLGPDLEPFRDVPPLLQRFQWLDLRENFSEQALGSLVAALTDSKPPAAIEDQLAAERELLDLQWRAQRYEVARARVEEEEQFLRQSLWQTRRALYVAMLVALLTGVTAVVAVAVVTLDSSGDDGFFGHTFALPATAALGAINALAAALLTLRTRRAERVWEARTGAAREQGQDD